MGDAQRAEAQLADGSMSADKVFVATAYAEFGISVQPAQPEQSEALFMLAENLPQLAAGAAMSQVRAKNDAAGRSVRALALCCAGFARRKP
jgi:hypothetical protein